MRFFLIIAIISVLTWQALFPNQTSGLEENHLQSLKEFRVVLDPRYTATLSAEVTSSVREITKEMGDSFKAGNLLIKLDDILFQAAHKKSQFMLERAEEQLSAKEQLYKDNVASSFELKAAQADLASAEMELTIARKNLKSCSIKAPYQGRLKKVMVNKHEVIQMGQPLIKIVQDNTLLAKLLIPSDYYDKVKIGETLELKLKEINFPVKAIISHIGAVIDPASSMMQIFAEVDNYEGKLRAGMTGTTSIK